MLECDKKLFASPSSDFHLAIPSEVEDYEADLCRLDRCMFDVDAFILISGIFLQGFPGNGVMHLYLCSRVVSEVILPRCD